MRTSKLGTAYKISIALVFVTDPCAPRARLYWELEKGKKQGLHTLDGGLWVQKAGLAVLDQPGCLSSSYLAGSGSAYYTQQDSCLD